MSFAALRDKRTARRDPAVVANAAPSPPQPQKQKPSSPTTVYADFPDDLLEVRTTASAGRTIHARSSADPDALTKGTFPLGRAVYGC